jgi:DNA-binding transcriptional LysR family regulator
MQPELRLVRYFVAVAEERNITRAAERLHISQPALSAAVRQLEQQLRVALLDRSDRVLAVTPAGMLLADEGGALLGFADRVFDAVRARDAAVVGRLRIGMSPTARYGLGPALLSAAAARASGVMLYPDLGLQAVREGLGVVVYVRSAFPEEVPGSVFVPVEPVVMFPFSLAWRAGARSAALDAVLDVARSLGAEEVP